MVYTYMYTIYKYGMPYINMVYFIHILYTIYKQWYTNIGRLCFGKCSHMFMCVDKCAVKERGQPQVSFSGTSPMFFETRYLTGLEHTTQARLADQRSLGLTLSLPPQHWYYKSKCYNLVFSRGSWRSNSGPFIYKASTLSTISLGSLSHLPSSNLGGGFLSVRIKKKGYNKNISPTHLKNYKL